MLRSWRTTLQERLAEGIAREAQLVHELFEREVLVRPGPQSRLAGAGDQLPETRVASKVRPQDEGVDEEADQRLQLGQGTVGHRRADRDVGPARV